MGILAIKTDGTEGQVGATPNARAASHSAAGPDFSTELDRKLDGKVDPSLKPDTGGTRHSARKVSSDEGRARQAFGGSAPSPVATVTPVPVGARSGLAACDKLILDSTGPSTHSAEDDEYPAQPAASARAAAGEEVASAQTTPHSARGKRLNLDVSTRGPGDMPAPVGPLESGYRDARAPWANKTVSADESSTPPQGGAGQTFATSEVTTNQGKASASRPGRAKASQDEAGDTKTASSLPWSGPVPGQDTSASGMGPTTIPEKTAAPRVMSRTEPGARLHGAGAVALQKGTSPSTDQAPLSSPAATESLPPKVSAGAQSMAGNGRGSDAQMPALAQPSGSSSVPSGLTDAAHTRPASEQRTSSTRVDSQGSRRAASVAGRDARLDAATASSQRQSFRMDAGESGHPDSSADHGGGGSAHSSAQVADNIGIAKTGLPVGQAVLQGHVESGAVSSEKGGTSQPRMRTPGAFAPEGYETHPGKIVSSARLFEQAGNAGMQVKLRSDALGPIEVHTVVKGSDIGASFHVEGRDSQVALANELPQLERALNERSLHVEHLDVLQGAVSGGSADTAGSGTSQGNASETQKFYSSHPTYASLPEVQIVPEDWNLGLSTTRINLRV